MPQALSGPLNWEAMSEEEDSPASPNRASRTLWNSISVVPVEFFLLLDYVAWRIFTLALASVTSISAVTILSADLCCMTDYPVFPVILFPTRLLQALV